VLKNDISSVQEQTTKQLSLKKHCERLDEVWIVFWNCEAMRYCTLTHVSSLKLEPVQIIQNQFLLDFGEGLATPNPLLMLNHQASLFIEV